MLRFSGTGVAQKKTPGGPPTPKNGGLPICHADGAAHTDLGARLNVQRRLEWSRGNDKGDSRGRSRGNLRAPRPAHVQVRAPRAWRGWGAPLESSSCATPAPTPPRSPYSIWPDHKFLPCIICCDLAVQGSRKRRLQGGPPPQKMLDCPFVTPKAPQDKKVLPCACI